MDPRIRILTAASVMLVGLGLALCFRHPPGETTMTIPGHSDPPAASKPATQSFAAAPPPLPMPRQLPAPPPAPRRTTTIVTPSDKPAPPPDFPKSYPDNTQMTSTRWGASMAEMLPETASAPPTHKIVDGDTLPLLAERYLGSASRAMEIYEANRNVLTEGPNILTNGVELQIPRSEQVSAK